MEQRRSTLSVRKASWVERDEGIGILFQIRVPCLTLNWDRQCEEVNNSVNKKGVNKI